MVTDTYLDWGPTGAPAWADVDGTLQVAHADQVWNPTVATDTAGSMTHHWTHDAWGNHDTVIAMHPTAPGPTLGFSSAVAAASAAGLVHMRARDYDPVTGQFLTPDPWQRPDGVPWVGVHAYTDGDPVSFWDPSGLRPKHNGCAPKRDGRGGPTSCGVEQEVYRLVCETAVYKGVSFFSWGDLARAGYYAGSDSQRSGDAAKSFLVSKAWEEGSLTAVFVFFGKGAAKTSARALIPVSAAATIADGACQAPGLRDRYGSPVRHSGDTGGVSW